MPDDQNPQREPSEVERFAAALRQDLGQFANGVRQELNTIKQQVAQRPAAAPPVPQMPVIPSDINDKLRERQWADPLEYAKELVGVATTEAEKRARAIIDQERAQNQASAAYQNFWQGFAQYNGDVADFQAQIEADLRRNGVDPMSLLQNGGAEQLSRYADQAANGVRSQVAARIEWQKQAEIAQKQGMRQASGAPGRQFYPQQQMQGDQIPERRDPQAELHEAVDDLKDRRAKQQWHNIDTPEYRSASRERDSKVAQQKYVAVGGRR